MNQFIENIILFLKNAFSNEIITFIISLMPILELRGGMIAASIMKIPYLKALIICIVGNILPIPFVLIFINKIVEFLEKFKLTKKIALHLKNKVEKNKNKITKYGYIGLTLFVGIPLPGTGAWTGALVASFLHMDFKKSIIYILLGILLASIIMSIISYGIIAKFI